MVDNASNVFEVTKCLSAAFQKSKFGIPYVLVWLIIWSLRSKTWGAWSGQESAHQQLWIESIFLSQEATRHWRGEQTMQGLSTSLICRLFVCLVIGSYPPQCIWMLFLMLHEIKTISQSMVTKFLIHTFQCFLCLMQPARSAKAN